MPDNGQEAGEEKNWTDDIVKGAELSDPTHSRCKGERLRGPLATKEPSGTLLAGSSGCGFVDALETASVCWLPVFLSLSLCGGGPQVLLQRPAAAARPGAQYPVLAVGVPVSFAFGSRATTCPRALTPWHVTLAADNGWDLT